MWYVPLPRSRERHLPSLIRLKASVHPGTKTDLGWWCRPARHADLIGSFGISKWPWLAARDYLPNSVPIFHTMDPQRTVAIPWCFVVLTFHGMHRDWLGGFFRQNYRHKTSDKITVTKQSSQIEAALCSISLFNSGFLRKIIYTTTTTMTFSSRSLSLLLICNAILSLAPSVHAAGLKGVKTAESHPGSRRLTKMQGPKARDCNFCTYCIGYFFFLGGIQLCVHDMPN